MARTTETELAENRRNKNLVRARYRRYNASPKGKARTHRYRHSPKGQETYRSYRGLERVRVRRYFQSKEYNRKWRPTIEQLAHRL